MISLSALVYAIVVLIIAGLVCGLLWWLIGYCNLPEPFAKVARIIVAIVAVLVIIGVLLHLIGIEIFKP